MDTATERKSIGKTQLLAALGERTEGLTQVQIAAVIEGFLELVQENIQNGVTVTLPGFGSWRPSERAERAGINPQTRQPITIPKQRTVTFSPGSTFKSALMGDQLIPP